MCKALVVSRSGFYSWQKRRPSRRLLDNNVLLSRIRVLFRSYRRKYGSPRIHDRLVRQGHACSRKRVARLMQLDGLLVRVKRRPRTGNEAGSNHAAYPNLLNREFAVGSVKAWVVDMTYIRCQEGWSYLAVVLNLGSRRVLGYAHGRRADRFLCIAALRMAVANRRPQEGTIHHSDQGSTYTSDDYQEELARQGFMVSMSRRGNCHDNAVAESFFATLKRETLQGRATRSFAELQSEIAWYIEEEYNLNRAHSSLGYLSPVEFERRNPVLI